MYLVVFQKEKGPVYFGPFETEKEACSFIAEDTDDHKPYMQVEALVFPYSDFMKESRIRWKEVQDLNRLLEDE